MVSDVYRAPGLTADWLNGWMAAIGVCVLLPDVKLSWSEDAVPVALFHTDARHLAERIGVGLSSIDISADSAFAVIKQKATVEVYCERAAVDRARRNLSEFPALHTDLGRDRFEPGAVIRGPLYPGAQGDSTMYRRVVRLTATLGPEFGDDVALALAGRSRRVNMSGLCLDYRRLAPWSEADTDQYVDPVVELLTFVAFRLFPLRGDGLRERQRGWQLTTRGKATFRWPVWTQPLDCWSIDALLDQLHSGRVASSASPHCFGVFESVQFRKRNTSEADDGYGARRVQ